MQCRRLLGCHDDVNFINSSVFIPLQPHPTRRTLQQLKLFPLCCCSCRWSCVFVSTLVSACGGFVSMLCAATDVCCTSVSVCVAMFVLVCLCLLLSR